MEAQTRQDMLCIREPFLSSRADHGAVIVHGHTPKREPIVQHNRIAIDTGAVLGGALTCVVLEEDNSAFCKDRRDFRVLRKAAASGVPQADRNVSAVRFAPPGNGILAVFVPSDDVIGSPDADN